MLDPRADTVATIGIGGSGSIMLSLQDHLKPTLIKCRVI